MVNADSAIPTMMLCMAIVRVRLAIATASGTLFVTQARTPIFEWKLVPGRNCVFATTA